MHPLGSEVTLVGLPQVEANDQHNHRVSVRVEEALHEFVHRVEHGLGMDEAGHHHRQAAWDRFRGKGRRKIGWWESLQNTARSSILNVLLFCIPPAWILYFVSESTKTDPIIVFCLCYLSIVPLVKLFQFGGKQMAFYAGKRIGDLLTVTLNNTVEAICSIVLLLKCELRILQANIVGIVLLHLLLVPGVLFLAGGTRVYQQELHQHYTLLNQSLLATGVLGLLVPAAFFAAIDTSAESDESLTQANSVNQFTQMSRVIAFVLFSVYIASRVFLFNPPKAENSDSITPVAKEHVHDEELHLEDKGPKVNVWFCIVFLFITTVVTGVTVEMVISLISEHGRQASRISEEWFGLVLIPMVSFSADAVIAVVYFLRRVLCLKPRPPKMLADDRAIDMSIQFILFWMPLLVLIAWGMNKPLLLLFDAYEVAVLLGASFLVNYVTADQKTNWAEGHIMIAYYFIIAFCAWFYKGQGVISRMFESCE